RQPEPMFTDPGETPAGKSGFAQLRAQIAKLERELEQKQDAVQRGETAAPPVTAPVTRQTRRNERRQTLSNAPQMSDLVAKAEALGADTAHGKDAMIKFAIMTIEGGYLGTLNLDRNKHGQGKRDGHLLAEAWTRGRDKAVVFDAKLDS